MRDYAARNRDQLREYHRDWTEANRDRLGRSRQRPARTIEEKRAARRDEYRRHRDRYLAFAARYRQENDARLREWFRAHRQLKRQYYRERSRIWAENNPGRQRALLLRRAHRKEERTPAWVDYRSINEIYRAKPSGMVVDHIVPIDGKTIDGYRISGLHVPWNLQYLTPAENSRKKNRMRAADHSIAEAPCNGENR